MSHRKIARSRVRAAAFVPTIALVAAGLATAGAGGAASAAPPDTSTEAKVKVSSSYINYAAPQAEKAFGTDAKVSKNPKLQAKAAKAVETALAKAEANDRKHAKGNPVAARQLAKDEAKAIQQKKSPKAVKGERKGAKETQEARLLTILV
jgi:immune inhibitor A